MEREEIFSKVLRAGEEPIFLMLDLLKQVTIT